MTDKMCEEFEKWAVSEGMWITRSYYYDEYTSVETKAAYLAWQAARRSMSDSKIIRKKKLRVMAVKNAVASSLLEGVKPTPQTVANLNRYAEGKVSIETLIADAKRRYARAG